MRKDSSLFVKFRSFPSSHGSFKVLSTVIINYLLLDLLVPSLVLQSFQLSFLQFIPTVLWFAYLKLSEFN